MTFISKLLAIITFLVTIIPVVVFGRFDNEFLRLNIIFSSLIFTYFANEHYLIRLMVIISQNFSKFLGYATPLLCYTCTWLSLHERIYHAASLLLKKWEIIVIFKHSCIIDMCRGGSSFDEIKYLKDGLKINDGLVLNHG